MPVTDDQHAPVVAVLTIAGSDSCGGAGIQADLKTFSALNVYGTSVVTAITAQNTHAVHAVFDAGPEAIRSQIDAVMAEIAPAAVKVGMLASRANVEAVAGKLREYETGPVVLDPVLAASSGPSLLGPDGLRALIERMLPLTSLLTPNLDEAEALLGTQVRSLEQMKEAAEQLRAMGPAHVLVKGGHLESGTATDVLFDGSALSVLEGRRIEGAASHGSGCVLSAAAAAYLALGMDMHTAVRAAKTFTAEAIRKRLRLGRTREISNPSWRINDFFLNRRC